MNLNHKHMLSLLQTGFTTIGVRFFNEAKIYDYKAPLADNLQIGDAVIVDSPTKGAVVVTVARVDAVPDIDMSSNFEYKWIVGKVDFAAYIARQNQEQEFKNVLLDIERSRQREELLKSFESHLPPDGEARRLFEAATKQFASPVLAPPFVPGT